MIEIPIAQYVALVGWNIALNKKTDALLEAVNAMPVSLEDLIPDWHKLELDHDRAKAIFDAIVGNI